MARCSSSTIASVVSMAVNNFEYAFTAPAPLFQMADKIFQQFKPRNRYVSVCFGKVIFKDCNVKYAHMHLQLFIGWSLKFLWLLRIWDMLSLFQHHCSYVIDTTQSNLSKVLKQERSSPSLKEINEKPWAWEHLLGRGSWVTVTEYVTASKKKVGSVQQ